MNADKTNLPLLDRYELFWLTFRELIFHMVASGISADEIVRSTIKAAEDLDLPSAKVNPCADPATAPAYEKWRNG